MEEEEKPPCIGHTFVRAWWHKMHMKCPICGGWPREPRS